MSAITWVNVTDAANNDPILVNFAAGGQTIILNVANTQLDVNQFDGEDGPITEAARCALAAHYALCSRETGPLIGQSEGGVSEQFATPLMNDDYRTTGYGRLFLMLIGSQAHGPRLL